MTAIQVILAVAALLWLSRFLKRFRTRGAVRAVAILAALGATSLVLFPNVSVRLAKLFGVARGVDLVIYLGFVALGFLWLHFAARQSDLERKLDDLVRELALRGENGGTPNSPPEPPTA
jgi:small membrane protein